MASRRSFILRIELLTTEIKEGKSFLEPVYLTTEKLRARGIGLEDRSEN
jgi:hypothetical protein